jgi:hypothetical protein
MNGLGSSPQILVPGGVTRRLAPTIEHRIEDPLFRADMCRGGPRQRTKRAAWELSARRRAAACEIGPAGAERDEWLPDHGVSFGEIEAECTRIAGCSGF